MGVYNHAVVDAFTTTHGLRVGLFELQIDQGFGLSLRWVLAANFQSAEVIAEPRWAEIIRFETMMCTDRS